MWTSNKKCENDSNEYEWVMSAKILQHSTKYIRKSTDAVKIEMDKWVNWRWKFFIHPSVYRWSSIDEEYNHAN